jgi:hypothetical protein
MRQACFQAKIMMKTMKIAALLLVVLVATALVMAVVLGVRADPMRVKLIAEPGVVETFKKSAGAATTQTKASPLVVQAQSFKKRIDPPPPPKPVDPNNPDGGKQVSYLPPPPPPASFDVVATSVDPLDPSRSYALLSQPGKGFFWVKPKDEVGRAVIKQIVAGKVITTDGREYAIPVNIKPSLLKPGSAVPPGYDNRGLPTSAPSLPATATGKPTVTTGKPAAGRAATPAKSAATVERPAAAANNAANQPAAPLSVEETKAAMELFKTIRENPESVGLTKEEAAQLGDLGEFLKDTNSVEAKPQGSAGNPGGSKKTE